MGRRRRIFLFLIAFIITLILIFILIFNVSRENLAVTGKVTLHDGQDFGEGYFFDDFNISLVENEYVNQRSINNLVVLGSSLYAEQERNLSQYENLIGYWDFNEDSEVVKDSGRLSHNGNRSAGNLSWTENGVSGGAYRFYGGNGESGYILIPSYYNISGQTFSLSFWMNPEDYKQSNDFESLFDQSSGSGGFSFAENFGFYSLQYRHSSKWKYMDANIHGSPELSGEWSHVVLVYNGTSFKFYKDSEQVFNTRGDLEYASSLSFYSNLRIGQRSVPSYGGFNGSIDEVSLFNYSLSQSEINGLYELAGFESNWIDAGRRIYSLNSSYDFEGNDLLVEVSFNGIDWCEVKNDGKAGGDCAVIGERFKYRVKFFSNSSMLNWIKFGWENDFIQSCRDGLDNDKDGFIDLVDVGCENEFDENENSGDYENFSFYWAISGSVGQTVDISSLPIKKNMIIIGEDGLYDSFNTSVEAVGSLGKHLDLIERAILNNIPEDFDGFVVYDWEKWGPLWDSGGEWYNEKNITREIVRAENPEWSDEEIEIESEARYNRDARTFWESTLNLTHELLPNAKSGFYGYPSRIYYVRYSDPVNGAIHRERNDELMWLWDASKALFPSIYQFLPSIEGEPNYGSDRLASFNADYIRDNIRETKRVARMVGGRTILPYTMWKYHESTAFGGLFINDVDARQVISIPAEEEVDGIVLWGSESNISEIYNYQTYWNNIMGVEIQRVGKETASEGNVCVDEDIDGFNDFGDGCGEIDCKAGDLTLFDSIESYVDNDGDSYGSGEVLNLCTNGYLPSGYVGAEYSGDCNDNDIEVNILEKEKCDGKDNNCDGDIDFAEMHEVANCFNESNELIEICSCDDLVRVSEFADRDFILMNDIDLKACGYGEGNNWIPIRGSNGFFGGNFDGNGKVISNLYINSSTLSVGFFDYLFGATVKNLSIINAYLDVYSGGMLADMSKGNTSIENIFLQGKIRTNAICGALVGYCIYSSNISKIHIDVDISSISLAGGLSGRSNGCAFEEILIDGSLNNLALIPARIEGYTLQSNFSNIATVNNFKLIYPGYFYAKVFGNLVGFDNLHDVYWLKENESEVCDTRNLTRSGCYYVDEESYFYGRENLPMSNWDENYWDFYSDGLPKLKIEREIENRVDVCYGNSFESPSGPFIDGGSGSSSSGSSGSSGGGGGGVSVTNYPRAPIQEDDLSDILKEEMQPDFEGTTEKGVSKKSSLVLIIVLVLALMVFAFFIVLELLRDDKKRKEEKED